MSTSSAPAATAYLTSASLTSRLVRPLGKAVATLATCTPLPLSSAAATCARSGYTQTAATWGAVGSAGSGRLALAQMARTLPGVSWPSSVVRSIIEIAVSSAHCLAVVLIDRLASMAARASAPTWSTPGSPCRNSRSEPALAGISTGALIGTPSCDHSHLRSRPRGQRTRRRGPAGPPCRPDHLLGRRNPLKIIAADANHRSGSSVLVTVRHWLLRRRIDYSRSKPWLGRAMDQGFPAGDFPGGSPTVLQRRVAEGAEPRTILEELWQTMQARLYGYGCKRLGDTSQADDFVQKVFLKMQLSFARMIAREPVEAWIFTVARNEIVDWYRERARSDVPAGAEFLDRDSAEESWRIPFEEQIETRIGDITPLYAYLRAIIARGWLRDDDLRAYWQGVVEEVPQRKLAEQFGVSQGRISQLKSEVGHK